MSEPSTSLPSPGPARSGKEEKRLYLHAFLSRGFFYIPVLVIHVRGELDRMGSENSYALTMSVLALFALGISLAEYPSGLLADWAGRVRSLILSSLLYAAGCGLLLLGNSVTVLAFAQLLLGVGIAFRSGAELALLHELLASRGALAHYTHALARMRFWNLVGIAGSSLIGGWLYSRNSSLVFTLTIVFTLIGILPLLGLREPHVERRSVSYLGVLRESVTHLRESGASQALVLLGGVGTTFYIFAYWSTQSYLGEAGVPTRPGWDSPSRAFPFCRP